MTGGRGEVEAFASSRFLAMFPSGGLREHAHGINLNNESLRCLSTTEPR